MNRRQTKKAIRKSQKYWESYWIAMAIHAFVRPQPVDDINVTAEYFFEGVRKNHRGMATGRVLDLAEDICRTRGAGFEDPTFQEFIFVYRRYAKIIQKSRSFSIAELKSLIKA